MQIEEITFDIAHVPSLDASSGSVSADIGYLEHENHANAFISIFEKFVQDNKETLHNYQSMTACATKPLGPLVSSLSGSDGVSRLISNPKEIGKELYYSYNTTVLLVLSGLHGSKELEIFFDNPEFTFTWNKI